MFSTIEVQFTVANMMVGEIMQCDAATWIIATSMLTIGIPPLNH